MQRCFAVAPRIALLLALTPTALLLGQSPQSSLPSAPSAGADALISPELRGDLAMAHQQYLAAIEAYRQAPLNSAVIWNKLGMAYHHLFAMDEAKRDYQRALHLRPAYPEALNNLGAIYYAKKDFHRAEKLYRQALKLQPESAPIYSNLGTAYFAERKVNKGIEAYRTAFTLDPRVFENASGQFVTEGLPARDRAEQDYCMAKLFAQSGQVDRALEYLRKALNEGFQDRKKLLVDETLASVRATPEFAQLMIEQKPR